MLGRVRHIPVQSTGDIGPPPHRLGPVNEDREYHLEPPHPCVYCRFTVDLARVVRLEGFQYAYACHGCVKPGTNGSTPT